MNLDKEAESMGIIRAAAHAVGGGLADQWLEDNTWNPEAEN